MKCSGKRLVRYLNILKEGEHSTLRHIELRRAFSEEHDEAVGRGYIGRMKINEAITWEVAPAGEDFLRQLKGDFRPASNLFAPYRFRVPDNISVMHYYTDIRQLLSDNLMKDIESPDPEYQEYLDEVNELGERYKT